MMSLILPWLVAICMLQAKFQSAVDWVRDQGFPTLNSLQEYAKHKPKDLVRGGTIYIVTLARNA